MSLGNQKKKTHEVHLNEIQNKDFKNMFIMHNFFEKQKKTHFKKTFENEVQF
jgi:hypothetical protein